MVIIKFLLFNKEEILQRTLKNVEDAKHPEAINGENIFEVTTYDTQEIKKGYRIAYKDIYGYWHELIIKGIDEIREDEGIKKQLFCESSFYETLGDYIDDKRPSGTANSALEVALQPTRWEVGQVDNLGTNKTNFYHISAKEAVQKVAEVWQGEIRTRITISGNKITGRYVDLFAQRGHDLGKRFTYTKDLESITKTIHRDDVITALYGYGKGEEIEDEEGNATGGFGRRINFSEINNGKAYVENNDAREIWGRNHNGQKVHVFGKVEFDDCEDKEELLDLTIAELKERSKVLVTYEAKVIDLKAFGFEHEGVELGDTVTVIDKEFTPELRVKARVVKIVRDLLEPENNEITLGNFITNIADTWNKQEEYINNFRDKQGVWDRSDIINSDGSINANYLNDVVDELNKQINADGGYVYISEDGEGLITYDKPIDQNPTMAIQLKGGSFRIANSKLPNGEWNWRSFGTGDGFTADMIVAGILKGGKVKFDLENGTLLIGNNTEDYQLWFDGETLHLNGINMKYYATQDDLDSIEVGGKNLIINDTNNELEEINASPNLLTDSEYQSTESDYVYIDAKFTSNYGKPIIRSGEVMTFSRGMGNLDTVDRITLTIAPMGELVEIPWDDDGNSSKFTFKVPDLSSYENVPELKSNERRLMIITLSGPSEVYNAKLEFGFTNTPYDSEKTTIEGYRYYLSEILKPNQFYVLTCNTKAKVWLKGELLGETEEGRFVFKTTYNVTDEIVLEKIENDIEWVQLERGKIHTDWSPSIEYIEGILDQKVDQDRIYDIEENIEKIADDIDRKIEDDVIQDLQNDFYDRLEKANEGNEQTEEDIIKLLDRTAALEYFMGDKAAAWHFIERSIRFTDEGIYVSSGNGAMGILISDDKISLIDNGKVVSFIEHQMMQISHGLFTDSATIGSYKTEDLPGTDISIDTYVGGD